MELAVPQSINGLLDANRPGTRWGGRPTFGIGGVSAQNTMMKTEPMRRDHEPPAVTARMGWRYHHMGVPTVTPRLGERYLPPLKMFVCGFESSPFGIEWMRFEPGSPVSELVRTVPHLAFEVDDLEAAVAGRQLLGDVSSPGEGVRVAMFVDDGMPIEVLQFDRATKDA